MRPEETTDEHDAAPHARRSWDRRGVGLFLLPDGSRPMVYEDVPACVRRIFDARVDALRRVKRAADGSEVARYRHVSAYRARAGAGCRGYQVQMSVGGRLVFLGTVADPRLGALVAVLASAHPELGASRAVHAWLARCVSTETSCRVWSATYAAAYEAAAACSGV